MATSLSLKAHFRTLRDPRRRHGQEHRFLDIILIGLCAVIGGANTWKGIALFGTTHYAWFKRFLALPNGIPSHDTFARVFQRLDPQAFQACLRPWLLSLSGALALPHIAIDGKTLRGAASDLGPLHLVSAWATQQHLSLGQVAVATKSNEITAIPPLLALLDLHGALVTVDAMGCQKAIAQQIVEGGGDYALAVKGNQEHLLEDIQRCVSQALDHGEEGRDYHVYRQEEKGHGRAEQRTYFVIPHPQGIRQQAEWAKLRVVGMCERRRTVEGKTSSELHYFIGSKRAGARYYGHVLRNHWRIENNLHWQMDVAFGEDQNRTAQQHAAENLALLRRVAVTLLKRHPSPESIRHKRQQAGWDTKFLEEVLRGSGNSESL
jgi:predicted transposase YbfD/YdcC